MRPASGFQLGLAKVRQQGHPGRGTASKCNSTLEGLTLNMSKNVYEKLITPINEQNGKRPSLPVGPRLAPCHTNDVLFVSITRLFTRESLPSLPVSGPRRGASRSEQFHCCMPKLNQTTCHYVSPKHASDAELVCRWPVGLHCACAHRHGPARPSANR